jgi:hypothetical protein
MDRTAAVIDQVWDALGDGPRARPRVELSGAPGLPSVYAVDAFATGIVSVATAAVAELWAARTGEAPRDAAVDRAHVAAAFRSERHVEPIGWTQPPIWDPIAGDYQTADGWIRIHTNYAHHRAAALQVLDTAADRAAVARAVAARDGEPLEAAIVDAGGAAAKMRTAAAWQAHPQGAAVAAEPLIATELTTTDRPRAPTAASAPLAGVRVLDLTRVIAGPVCTRVLAAYGADVLRIDPPGFAEVPALLGDTTAGKRRAALDLRTADGRAVFVRLATSADVLVCGYRASALDRLGLGVGVLRAANPALTTLYLDAYGWTGPWRDRRGFDSLVQMSTGIAARTCDARGDAPPGALPAQALDHSAGYLLAAAACRALTRRWERGVATMARISLARMARLLVELGDDGDLDAPGATSAAGYRDRQDSGFGPLWCVRCPGELTGFTPRWTIQAGPLGCDAAAWP